MSNRRNFDAGEFDNSMNLYASGTMGVPKCVQLTHKLILSQKAGQETGIRMRTSDSLLACLGIIVLRM